MKSFKKKDEKRKSYFPRLKPQKTKKKKNATN